MTFLILLQGHGAFLLSAFPTPQVGPDSLMDEPDTLIIAGLPAVHCSFLRPDLNITWLTMSLILFGLL
jgi:hypothetical protein